MTMIKTLTLALLKSLLFIQLLAGCSLCAQTNENYNLLWKIEGKDMPLPSYLFGTMHVDDIRAFKFSDAVMPAIRSCEMFALEINMDSVYTALNNKVIKEDPKDIFKSVLSNDEYQRLVERFTEVNGYSFENTELKDPNIILNLLYPDEDKLGDKSTFADLFLLSQAKTMQKEITGLEAIESQMNYFESLNKEDQKDHILSQIKNTIPEIDSMKNALTEIYYKGNIYYIERYMIEELNGFDEEFIERNKIMAKSIDKIIRQRTLFSAVGVAHLPGEFGVINLLKKEGYILTPMVANFTGVADTFKIDESKFNWHTFIDEDLGYSVELPEAPNYTKDAGSFEVNTYYSPIHKASYVMFGLDLRHTPSDSLPKRELIDNYLNRLKNTYNGKIVYNRETEIEGGIQSKIILVEESKKTISALMTIKDKMVYYLTVQTETPSSNLKSVDRFLNSIKLFAPKPSKNKPKEWDVYTYEKGAFSISVPGTPTDISREAPNPLDPDEDPYVLKMFNVINRAKDDNYLFRYNDLPKGYYLEDKEGVFESMNENIVSNGSIINEPKVIFLNGHEGREYEVLIQNKYHSIIRVYLRGNRTYLLLQQKLNEIDKVDVDNPFFNDFKFLDYKPAKIEPYNIENTDLSFNIFDNVKVVLDYEDFDSSYLKGSNEYYTTNPNTGDVYQLAYGEFQKYFKVNDLTEFYTDNADLLKNWNDSIIHKHAFKVGDSEGLEFHIKGKTSNIISKHRIWIQNKHKYIFSAYITQNEHSEKITDSIFNSFIDKSKPKEFDIYASKTALILQDLKSKDSIVRNRALGAFSYYEFDTNDLPKLHSAFTTTYSNNEIDETVKTLILDEFFGLNNENTLKLVKEEYQKHNYSDQFKSKILTLVPQLNDTDAIPTYLELLFENPPLQSEDFNWQMFSPLRDSIPLAVANFDKLIALNSYENLRSNVLEISANILNDTTYSYRVIGNRIDKLMTFSREDLANYISEANDTTNYNYTYNSRIYNYLRLMNTSYVDRTLTNEFTNKLINRKDNDWFVTNATVARIKNELPINKVFLNSRIDSISSRYAIIKAFHNLNQLHKIPAKYLKDENMAILSLHNHLEDIDEYGFQISLLGDFKTDDHRFYGASVTYDFDDGTRESYFALIGPVYQVSQDTELTLYNISTDWSHVDEDWQSQALLLLNEFKEE